MGRPARESPETVTFRWIIVTPPNYYEGVATIGNTCLYGATGATLFASGTVGERFAVRNSGALACVEGTGDHACEYMTGGTVVILGETGINFGAGMTGGAAFVYDRHKTFIDSLNGELVEARRIDVDDDNEGKLYLKKILVSFHNRTRSPESRFRRAGSTCAIPNRSRSGQRFSCSCRWTSLCCSCREK